MLPYATEQNVVKIVNEKLKEQGSQPIDKDTIVSIVNESIESGDISAFEEVEIKIYYSDLDAEQLQDNVVLLRNQEKIVALENIYNKLVLNKQVLGCYETPEYNAQSFGLLKDRVGGSCNFVEVSNDTGFGFGPTINAGNNTYRTAFVIYGTLIQPMITDPTALVTLLATDPTKYISLKFRIEK